MGHRRRAAIKAWAESLVDEGDFTADHRSLHRVAQAYEHVNGG